MTFFWIDDLKGMMGKGAIMLGYFFFFFFLFMFYVYVQPYGL